MILRAGPNSTHLTSPTGGQRVFSDRQSRGAPQGEFACFDVWYLCVLARDDARVHVCVYVYVCVCVSVCIGVDV